MMLLVIIKCEIFQKIFKKKNYVGFLAFLASLLIRLILNVAPMVPIKYVITPNASKILS